MALTRGGEQCPESSKAPSRRRDAARCLFVSWGGRIVWNVASFGKMVSILGEHPYSSYVNYKNEPFIDRQEAVKVIAERAEAAKKAAKK